MKRNSKIIILISLLISCLCMLFAVGCKKEQSEYANVYYANYGEWFAVPVADKAEMYYSDGRQAPIQDGRVFIDDTNDYSLKLKYDGDKYQAIVKINAEIMPNIYVSQDVVYGAVGKELQLPTVTAHDGVKELSVSSKLMQGETPVEIADGFVPTAKGEYEYVLSATSGAGKAFEKSIPVYVEESEQDYADKIISFDKAYGEQQIAFANAKASYSKDVAFEDESGSLRVNISPRMDNEMILTNAQIEDISQYDAIYFYVYNDTDVPVELSVCWGGWPYPTLRSHQWTEVVFTTKELADILKNVSYKAIKQNVSLEHINGMNFVYNTSHLDYVLHDDAIYFSSIRGLKYLDADSLQERMSKVNTEESIGLREITLLDCSYEALEIEEQSKVTAYAQYSELKIDKLMTSYGVERQEDKVVYMDDSTAQALQLETVDWVIPQWTVSDEKTAPNGEGTAKTTINKGEELVFRIAQPFIYDLSEYDYVAFYVYFEHDANLKLYNWDSKWKIGDGFDTELMPSKWNKVQFPLINDTDIEGSAIWIHQYLGMEETLGEDKNGDGDLDDTAYGFSDDITFYISSIYAMQGNPDFSEEALPFDEEKGLEYIESWNNEDITYNTQEEYVYGTDTGSVKVTPSDSADGGYLQLAITKTYLRAETGTVLFSMYAYNDSTTCNYVLYFTKKSLAVENAQSATLAKGAWTEVVLALSAGQKLSDYAMVVMQETEEDWYSWTFNAGDSLYFSRMRYDADFAQNGLHLGTSYGVKQLEILDYEDNASVEYTTTKKYGNESGSTRVYASAESDGGQLYMNLRYTGEGMKTACMYSMYVWYEGTAEYYVYFPEKYGYSTADGTKLVSGQWTQILLNVPKNKSLSDYSMMIMTTNWQFAVTDEVYLSSMYGVASDGLRFDLSHSASIVGKASNVNAKEMSLTYTTQKAYGEEAGSLQVTTTKASGTRVMLDINLAPITNESATYEMYVWYEGDGDYTFRFIDKGYYFAGSGTTLVSGTWTKISFVLPTGKMLSDYTILIEGANGVARNETFYFSALRQVEQ